MLRFFTKLFGLRGKQARSRFDGYARPTVMCLENRLAPAIIGHHAIGVPATPPQATVVANHLAFLTAPTETSAGQTLGSVKVAVENAEGHILNADKDGSVTLSAPSGLVPVSAPIKNGVAVFSDVALDKAGTYALTASSSGVTGAQSTPILVTPAAPSALAFLPIANGTAGKKLAAVKVAVVDRFGNRVGLESSVTIDISIASGPGVFATGSKLSAKTVLGVATFTNLVLDTAGAYTLGAAPVLFPIASATPAPLTISPGPASQMVFLPQGGSGGSPYQFTGVAGTPLDPVRVAIEDRFGNIETSINGTSLTLKVGHPMSSGYCDTDYCYTIVKNAPIYDGIASFDDVVVNKAGSYQLSVAAIRLPSGGAKVQPPKFPLLLNPSLSSNPGGGFTAS